MGKAFLTGALPCLVTLVGFALGAGACLAPGSQTAPLALCASLALDAIDGGLARYLDAESEFGYWLDWTVDVALSYAIAWAFFPALAVFISAALAAIQSAMLTKKERVSGRAAMTLAAVLQFFVANP